MILMVSLKHWKAGFDSSVIAYLIFFVYTIGEIYFAYCLSYTPIFPYCQNYFAW